MKSDPTNKSGRCVRRWWSISLLALSVATGALACTQQATTPAAATANGGLAAVAATAVTDAAPDIRDVVIELDGLLNDAWVQAGVTPTPTAADATFLRRVSLDLAGVVPDIAATKAFLASGKRSALVDGLVGSDAFARHWTNYWDDLLMAQGRSQLVDRGAFRQWLHREMADGTRYDQLVRKLITATGVNSTGGRRNMMMAYEPTAAATEPAEGVNGAVNWVLRGARSPQDLAGSASRVFLGVQIQCAECHDHPTEKWTQDDFRGFTSAFMRADGVPIDKGRVMGIRRVDLVDNASMNRRLRRRMRRTGYGEQQPIGLDGTSLESDNPRLALADWMTAPDNPWFARAIVNRMWGYFNGGGFIDPVDDIRADSEVVAPAVLAALTRDFVDNGYDLRRLMRVIVSTSAYQRSSLPPGATAASLWSAFELRPMNDAQLLDSLVTASGIEPVLEEIAGERLPRIKARMRKQFRFTFDVDEDSDDDAFTGTISQALMQMNGMLASAGCSALDGSTLGDAARAGGGDGATIETLYLATLSRQPTSEELAFWTQYVDEAATAETKVRRPRGGGPVGRVYRRKRLADLGPRDVAYEDVLWALLNSSEFFFIH